MRCVNLQGTSSAKRLIICQTPELKVYHCEGKHSLSVSRTKNYTFISINEAFVYTNQTFIPITEALIYSFPCRQAMFASSVKEYFLIMIVFTHTKCIFVHYI